MRAKYLKITSPRPGTANPREIPEEISSQAWTARDDRDRRPASYGAALKDLTRSDERITGLRTDTCPSDDGNGPCFASAKCEVFRNSLRYKALSTTTSTRNATSSHDKYSRPAATPPLLSSAGLVRPENRHLCAESKTFFVSLTVPLELISCFAVPDSKHWQLQQSGEKPADLLTYIISLFHFASISRGPRVAVLPNVVTLPIGSTRGDPPK